jgi:excisionase family DNA binding protein
MYNKSIPTSVPVKTGRAIDPDFDFLTLEEVAARIGVLPDTLNRWRCNGNYDLPFIKIGTLVKYRRSDVLAWLEKRKFTKSPGRGRH